nr:hypothetical protein [Pirellulimonas nuda]
MRLDEAGPRLQQQRVAGLEADVADLVGEPLAIAMDRHNRRVVALAETRLAHQLAKDRRRA